MLSSDTTKCSSSLEMKLPLIYFLVFFAGAFQAQVTIAGSIALAEVDQLSLITRYAGMGYNLLSANPEGDFNLGGVDPGIKSTRFIFKHTYNNGNKAYYMGKSLQVPDQVEFHMAQSCAMSQVYSAYSGQTSYRKTLSMNIETSGSYN